MSERRIVSWRPAPPAAWQQRLLIWLLGVLPPSVRRRGFAWLVRLPPGNRLRAWVLALGAHTGWELFNARRFELLMRVYDPGAEVIWAGERKLFDLPDHFFGHAELMRAFNSMHQLASSGIDAQFRVVELLDAGGPCFAARLVQSNIWSRSATPMLQEITSVWTIAGVGVSRQLLTWDDGRGDLEAELIATLEAAR